MKEPTQTTTQHVKKIMRQTEKAKFPFPTPRPPQDASTTLKGRESSSFQHNLSIENTGQNVIPQSTIPPIMSCKLECQNNLTRTLSS
jgi:hypothetical protein